MSRKTWSYILWPVVILNLIPVCIFGAVFASASASGGSPQNVDTTRPLFWLYMAIVVINWLLAFYVIRTCGGVGKTVRGLMAADGQIFRFRWKPAAGLFLAFNGIWALYVLVYSRLAGGWPSYGSFQTWQKILFIGLLPVSAGFTEELFWRGFIITEVEAAGVPSKRAVLYSALGFALVHGIFFPDKLLATFLIGLAGGLYYVRERKLLPLMLTHAVMDLWSYELSLSG